MLNKSKRNTMTQHFFIRNYIELILPKSIKKILLVIQRNNKRNTVKGGLEEEISFQF